MFLSSRINRFLKFAFCLLVAWLVSGSQPAGAESCPPISGGRPALEQVDVERRLGFIRDRMAYDASKARIWSEAWMITWGVLTGGQLALVAFFDGGPQADLYVGAGSSFIGFAGQLILPLSVKSDQTQLENHINMAGRAAERCKLLEHAEQVFIENAENEAEGVHWLMHGANVLINVGAMLILGLGFDRWDSGAINATAGIALGELMIFSQPTGLIDDLERYRRGEIGDLDKTAWQWNLAPVISHNAYSLQLVVSF